MTIAKDHLRGFQKGLDLTQEAVATTENLEKVAKISYRTIDFFSLLTGKVSSAFTMLSSRLKDTADVAESLRLISRVKEFACPVNGEYFLKKNTWQKCADRIFLTAATVFKTINLAVKFTFISLGKIAKFAIGKVPVTWIVPESLMVVSNLFGAWDNKNIHQKASQKLAIANNKIEKWSNRSVMVADVRAGECETIFNLKNSYQLKSAYLERDIHDSDRTTESKATAKKTATLNKYRHRLDLIAKDSYAELADDLAKQDAALKHRHWNIERDHQKICQNKARLGIASNISKIFVISMAFTGMALGLCTVPWILSLTAVGISTDTIGLTKSLYDYSTKNNSLLTKAIPA